MLRLGHGKASKGSSFLVSLRLNGSFRDEVHGGTE